MYGSLVVGQREWLYVFAMFSVVTMEKILGTAQWKLINYNQEVNKALPTGA